MKILWLAHDSNMSGANVCLSEFLKIMKDAGANNYLIVPKHNGMSSNAKDSTINISTVKFYSWNWPIGSTPPLPFKIRRWLRNNKAVNDVVAIIKNVDPDFVVTNTIVTPIAALAAKRTRKKHVWLIHEFGEEDHGYEIGRSFNSAAKIINKLSCKVAFVSEAVQKKFAPFIVNDKQHLVHNAILIPVSNNFNTPVSDHLKLIMLGQIAPSKNQLDALKAIKILLKCGVSLTLTITGKSDDADYLKLLKDFIEENNLQPNVVFEGVTNKPQEVLIQHELLLMCSRMEAFGRVTVEALKLGMPVIGANAGGTNEIVVDGDNGYLYESGKYKDLAAKILLYNQTKHHFNKEKIAEKSRKKYNAQSTLAELMELFQ